MATRVTLLKKKQSIKEVKKEGSKSYYYLDFWPPIAHPKTGKPTRRQFLNLFIYDDPKTAEEKRHNKESKAKAEFSEATRRNEVNKPEIYTGFEKEQLRLKEVGTKSFFDYFLKLANKQEGRSKIIWTSTLTHLQGFHKGPLTFNDINEGFCNDFKDHLLKAKITHSGRSALSHNTAVIYFSKFKSALKQAHRDKLITIDINYGLRAIKPEETRREFLTLDEMNTLIQTECSMPVMKQAAIFSIYTGMRFSDIQKLTWGEIEEKDADNIVINFRQQKTKGVETLPISKDALLFIGARGKDTDRVFDGLLYSSYYNKVLAKWIALAGITKNITWHSMRHSYATLQLTLGTDIYTVSKLLGHKDIKTTQIYAKIIDETKRTAANRIQLNINNWK